MTISAISSWVMAMETWFSRNGGTGKCAMLWPIERYISTARKPSEVNNRFLSTGVSRSCKASSASPAALSARFAPLGEAP